MLFDVVSQKHRSLKPEFKRKNENQLARVCEPMECGKKLRGCEEFVRKTMECNQETVRKQEP